MIRWCLASLSVCALGCDGGSPPGGSFPVVENPALVSTVAAHLALSIGTAEGSGPDVFGRIDYVVADSGGRIYVGDGLSQTIKVFDSSGTFVRSIGREGEGPGEFQGMTGLTVDGLGRLYVWDPWQRRISVFDTTGTLIRTQSRSWGARILPWPGLFDSDGTLLDLAIRHRGLSREERVTQRFATEVVPIRFSAELAPLDTLSPLSMERTAYAGLYPVPLEPRLTFAFEPDGSSWSNQGAEYRVLRINAAGDTVHAFTVAASLTPVTAEERDSLARHARVPPPPMDPGLIPHVRPAISGLVRLAPGWVGVFPESGEDTGRYLDVFGPTGRHVARVDLQFRLQLGPPAPSWANGTLLGVRQDDLDVQYVVGLDLGVPDLH